MHRISVGIVFACSAVVLAAGTEFARLVTESEEPGHQAVATPSAAGDSGLLAEFRKIESDRAEALRLGDVAAVDRLYADDFVGVSRTGQIVRKPDVLRTVRERGVNPVVFSMVELEVRWIDGLAFVLGHHVGKDPSGKFVREGRVLHVYAKRGDQWKVVSAQATPLVREPPAPSPPAAQ